jgi:hypothetical protein
MSSRYVRTKVRDWLNMGSIPHYDTTNYEVNPNDAMWVTAEWTYSNRSVEDYCGGSIEEGTFTVALFGMPGIGDDTLLEAAETEMELLMTRVDISGNLVLLDYNPAIDFREGEYYVAEFLVNYEYRS